jgi:hypothetical protein
MWITVIAKVIQVIIITNYVHEKHAEGYTVKLGIN